MTKLNELYTDFHRIDLDIPGGYSRVADVVAHQGDGSLMHRAFKLMRGDLVGRKEVTLQRIVQGIFCNFSQSHLCAGSIKLYLQKLYMFCPLATLH